VPSGHANQYGGNGALFGPKAFEELEDMYPYCPTTGHYLQNRFSRDATRALSRQSLLLCHRHKLVKIDQTILIAINFTEQPFPRDIKLIHGDFAITIAINGGKFFFGFFWI